MVVGAYVFYKNGHARMNRMYRRTVEVFGQMLNALDLNDSDSD